MSDGPSPDRRPVNVGSARLFVEALLLILLWVAGFVAGTPAVLLAIGWNAAIWVASIDGLAFAGVDPGQLVPLSTVFATAAAVAPYLLIELVAYVLGAMSAVFASRALSRYRAGDTRRRPVFRAVALLLVGAAALIVLAALVEDRLTPLLLAG